MTASGTFSDYYGSPPTGFGLGIPVGGNLSGPLPDSLPYTGTGFDEAISGKSIFAVPEPDIALLMLGGLGALTLFQRKTRRLHSVIRRSSFQRFCWRCSGCFASAPG